MTKERIEAIRASAQRILDAGVGDDWTINDREDEPHFDCGLTYAEVRDLAAELLALYK